MLHVRFDGRSYDFDLHDAGIRPGMSDRDIRERVAWKLDVSRQSLARHVVDRTPRGDLIVRPEAVYG